MTLMGSPRIIFLDEPTAGLDPRGRRTMWDLIRSLVREEAVTIFLTTQYLEEADQLADLVAVLTTARSSRRAPRPSETASPRRPRAADLHVGERAGRRGQAVATLASRTTSAGPCRWPATTAGARCRTCSADRCRYRAARHAAHARSGRCLPGPHRPGQEGRHDTSAQALATPGRSASVKVYPLRDTSTMLRRNLKQEMRDKVAVVAIIGIPVLFLLLFVYVFGGALRTRCSRPARPATSTTSCRG